MKNILRFYSCACLLLAVNSPSSFAQTVLVSTFPPPAIGTVDSVYIAQATVLPGNGGNGVTWDLSALSPTFEGTATAVDPAATPYFDSFSTANICSKLTLAGTNTNAYVYDR